jgi:hypothetical protein
VLVARLVAVASTNGLASVHGALRGRVQIAEDLDELPLLLSAGVTPLAVSVEHAAAVDSLRRRRAAKLRRSADLVN